MIIYVPKTLVKNVKSQDCLLTSLDYFLKMLSHSEARCTMQQLRISAWAKGRPQRIDIDGHLRPHGLDKATKRRQLLQQFQVAPIQQVHDAAPLREHCRAGVGKSFWKLDHGRSMFWIFQPLNMLHRFLDSLIYQCLEAFSFHSCCPGTTESDRKSLHESGWLSRPNAGTLS